jgi:hypothetical protein
MSAPFLTRISKDTGGESHECRPFAAAEVVDAGHHEKPDRVLDLLGASRREHA